MILFHEASFGMILLFVIEMNGNTKDIAKTGRSLIGQSAMENHFKRRADAKVRQDFAAEVEPQYDNRQPGKKRSQKATG
jgi:hypothetical protein